MMPLVFGINSDEGCELKHVGLGVKVLRGMQPSSSGCELKQRKGVAFSVEAKQPPSGGCELKRRRASAGGLPPPARSCLRAAVS